MDKKSWEEKAAGMGVDLAAIGASAAAGAAVGTAVPIPIVGTLVGAGAGILASIAMERKFYGGKSIIEWGKIGVKNGLTTLSKGLKNVFV